MRSFWSRIPMLRVAFAIIAGIGLEIAVNGFVSSSVKALWVAVFLLLAALAVILLVTNIKNVTTSYRLRLFNGLALNIFIVAFAYILTWFYTQKNYPDAFSNFLTDKNVIVVKITEPPVLRDKVVVANADVMEVNNNIGHFTTSGNIQLDFLRDSVCEKLNYGDVLLINSNIEAIKDPQNPYEFNFKTHFAFRNIYSRAFVVPSQWTWVDHNKGNFLLASVYNLRSSFLKIIARYVEDENNFSVASAIMLGDRDYIQPGIKQAYANAGAVHLLSVSGLHVGIMFLMLNFLLAWMDKRGRKAAFAKAGLIIAFIWFYACITGLNPPVLRSAMMFTLLQLGYVLIRHVNTYNMIAASAVLLMLFNPFVITEVGFQLSYIAVVGIVYLQPQIANLFIVKITRAPAFKSESNWFVKPVVLLRYDLKWLMLKVLDFCWQLIAASIAAQIATLPLCLLYFYQFPNLFLLSNVVVIPLSNLLLFAGTALFAVAHIPYVNDFAGWIFNAILSLLDRFIFWVDSLPFAVTKGICVSAIEMVLLYILILLLCWLSEERKNKILVSALAVILILASLSSFKKFVRHGQKEVTVYSVSKQKAISFISDKTVYYDIDTALYNNQSNMLFHIYHHWWEGGITSEIPLTDSILKPGIYSCRIPQGRVVLFEGKKILMVDSLSTANIFGTKTKLKPDLVIFSGTLKVSIPVLKRSIDFDEVVFDSSCKPASRKRWKKDCSDLNINFWDVYTNGAYIWDLRNGDQ